MALTKKDIVLGFESDIYVKLSGLSATEIGKDEVGKIYSISGTLDFYTDSSKEYHYKQESVSVEGRESDISISGVYSLVKSNEQFEGFVDA